VDDFASEVIFPVKDKLKEAYRTYTTCKKEFLQAGEDEKQQERELALAQFEVEEITNARLIIGEDEELEERYRRMNNSRKIAESVSKVSQAIGTENESGAGIGISFALRELKSVSSLDGELSDMEQQLMQIEDMLSDLNRGVAFYLDSLEFSQEEYMETEERLNVYNHLKNKYGNTVEEVLAYLEKQSAKLEKMADYESYLNALQTKMAEAEADVIAYSKQLSVLRIDAAKRLGNQMNEALLDLNFANVDFDAVVVTDVTVRSEEGFDDIEFMISLNPGEPKKPLTMVASGGELSRIMLALKTIMADKENIETLIFDEIDSGISGRTAWKVSEKMAVLGKEHQLICITHLPQIAAMADAHYVIEKTVDEVAAITEIRRLAKEDELSEIARLLGSDSITETVLANAKELKEMANQTKGY